MKKHCTEISSRQGRSVKAAAIVFGLFAMMSTASAQNGAPTTQDSAAHAARQDSIQAAQAACTQLKAYGKQATASSLKALRQKGALASSIDSMNGQLSRGGKYDDVLQKGLGLNSLPDSMQTVAAAAGPSCKMIPPIAAFTQMVNAEAQRGPKLGIMMEPLTAQAAKDAGLTDTQGLRVSSVTAGLGAQAAGVVAGDIIVGVDGKPVANPGQFLESARTWKDGQVVSLELVRKGGTREKVDVKVIEKQ